MHVIQGSTFRVVVACAFMALTLGGCGTGKGERALSGGAIGAGAGTVGAVLLNANPLAGALVGGAAGAVTGAATTKKDINFGDVN